MWLSVQSLLRAPLLVYTGLTVDQLFRADKSCVVEGVHAAKVLNAMVYVQFLPKIGQNFVKSLQPNSVDFTVKLQEVRDGDALHKSSVPGKLQKSWAALGLGRLD